MIAKSKLYWRSTPHIFKRRTFYVGCTRCDLAEHSPNTMHIGVEPVIKEPKIISNSRLRWRNTPHTYRDNWWGPVCTLCALSKRSPIHTEVTL